MNMIKITDLEKIYRTEEVETVALNKLSMEVKEGAIVLTAGSQSKAALIGRNRRREAELKQILKDTFNLELKIV